MSGRKYTTVTISESEYHRLREQARQLSRLQENLPELRDALYGIQRVISSNIQRMEERQREFQRALNQVHETIREIETETARRLEEQQKRMREAIGDLRREVKSLLKEQEEQLRKEIAETRKHLQTQIDALLTKEKQKSELALEWIKSAQILRDFIVNNYPRHNKFRPGALEKLERDLQLAQQNFQQGITEAAIASAQSAYLGLSDLRLELEQLETQWQLLQSSALRSTEEILAIARANRQCKAIDINGNELDITIEVDYWTEGKLNKLIQEVEQLQEKIKSEEPIMSIADLKEIVENTAPFLRNQLEEIIWEARLKVLGSQLRINIADIALQALETQNYHLVDATYEEQDQRGKYVVKVRGPQNSEVVIVISPKEGQYLENDLEIHSFDSEQWSEETLQNRANELSNALSSHGLQAPKPKQIAQYPDPNLRDIERIKQPKPKTERKTTNRES
jgi:hypothetical protein